MVETRHRDYGANPSSSTKSRQKGATKPITKNSRKVSKVTPPKAGAVKDSRVQKPKGTKAKSLLPPRPGTTAHAAAVKRLDWALWDAERVHVCWQDGEGRHPVTGAVLFPVPNDAQALAEMDKVASAKRVVNQKKRAEAKA